MDDGTPDRQDVSKQQREGVFQPTETYSFHTLAVLKVCTNAHLFGYVESTAVALRMEPATTKGFSQDGIVRFLQTLEKKSAVSTSAGKACSDLVVLLQQITFTLGFL